MLSLNHHNQIVTRYVLPEWIRWPCVKDGNVVRKRENHEHQDKYSKPCSVFLRDCSDVRRCCDVLLLRAVTVECFEPKFGWRMTLCKGSIPCVSVPFPHAYPLQCSRQPIAKPYCTCSSIWPDPDS